MANVMWRNRLTIARDVFHSHPDLLANQPGFSDSMYWDMAALAMLENPRDS